MPPETNDSQPLPPEQPIPEPTGPTPVPPSAPSELSSPSNTPQVVSPVVSTESNGQATPVGPQLTGTASTSPSGVIVSVHDDQPQNLPAFSAPSTKRKRRFPVKLALIIAAIIIVLGGGSAAAYYGYVVPHQPASVLKTAVLNSIQQKQLSFSGNLTVDSTDNSGVSFKGSYSGATDLTTKDSDVQLTLTVAGITFPVEARLVDQNLYFKVGDLSSLDSYISSLTAGDPTTSQALTSVIDSVSKDLSNQWIEVDSTLLKQADTTCELDTSLSITKADITLLQQQYQKNEFVTIKDTTSSSVNGKPAEKFDLSLNDDKTAAYLKTLNQLSAIKALDSCNGSKSPSLDTSSLADNENTPVSVWVDKQTNQIVKFSTQSTAQDLQKDHEEASDTTTLTYGHVSVTAPTGAKPVSQVVSELEQAIAANPNTAPLLDLLDTGTGSTSNLFTGSL